jgi:hypothetical protein
MPVQGFIDDSGAKGQGRHFVLAGLIAHSDEWALFSDEWRICLAQKPAIRYFKMREAAGRTAQFRRFSKSQRDDKLRSLAQIINGYAKISIYFAVDLDAHAETFGRINKKPLNEPYFWPFQNVTLGTCFELWDLGWRERFEIIFDEHVIFGPRAKAWYPALRDVMKVREPDAYLIMPVDPLFRTDDEFTPLQAADLFAWCIRNGSNNPTDNAFNWLLAEMRSVSPSSYSGYYDRARLTSTLEGAESEAKQNAAFLRDLAAKYRKLFGK